MGGITEIVLKTMIQGFSTVSFIEIEIEKSEHSNSMVRFIDLDTNPWFYYNFQ